MPVVDVVGGGPVEYGVKRGKAWFIERGVWGEWEVCTECGEFTAVCTECGVNGEVVCWERTESGLVLP